LYNKGIPFLSVKSKTFGTLGFSWTNLLALVELTSCTLEATYLAAAFNIALALNSPS